MNSQAIAQQEILSVPGVTTATHTRRISLQVLMAALIGDLIVVILGLAAGSWLRFESPLAGYGVPARSVLDWTDYGRHIALGTVVYAALLMYFQMYSLPRMLRLRHALTTVVKTAVVWLLMYSALTSMLRVTEPVSRIYVVIAFVTTVAGLTAWRYLLHRFISRAIAMGRLRQRILFVGWSPQAAALVEAITSDRGHLYEVAGCVPSADGSYLQSPPARIRKLGDYGELTKLLHAHEVDMVMLADMNLPHGDTVALANVCEKELVDFKVIPSCFEILLSGLHLETVSGVPVLGVSRLPLDHPFSVALKQVIDVIGGVVGLFIALPIIAVFGLLVYLESPGPIFYRQRRLGRDGRPFWIIKIRSMRLDAEKDGKVGWSTKEDPRRLRVGSLMRRWNIDELPQFWNVLTGDMSLVGPRPERPELIVNFKEAIPHYNARHNIKPGITGWAQVNGLRGDTDLNERIRYDLYYIENWSVFLDIQIMFMTLFTHKNAC